MSEIVLESRESCLALASFLKNSGINVRRSDCETF